MITKHGVRILFKNGIASAHSSAVKGNNLYQSKFFFFLNYVLWLLSFHHWRAEAKKSNNKEKQWPCSILFKHHIYQWLIQICIYVLQLFFIIFLILVTTPLCLNHLAIYLLYLKIYPMNNKTSSGKSFLQQSHAVCERECITWSLGFAGVWMDGIWAFSTGLDQRIRCWSIDHHGKLTENSHLIISVPEPEALSAVKCGRWIFSIFFYFGLTAIVFRLISPMLSCHLFMLLDRCQKQISNCCRWKRYASGWVLFLP